MTLTIEMIDLQKIIEKLFDSLVTIWLLDDL